MFFCKFTKKSSFFSLFFYSFLSRFFHLMYIFRHYQCLHHLHENYFFLDGCLSKEHDDLPYTSHTRPCQSTHEKAKPAKMLSGRPILFFSFFFFFFLHHFLSSSFFTFLIIAICYLCLYTHTALSTFFFFVILTFNRQCMSLVINNIQFFFISQRLSCFSFLLCIQLIDICEKRTLFEYILHQYMNY